MKEKGRKRKGKKKTGVYIYWTILLPPWGDDVIWRKNMKRWRRKRGNSEGKRRIDRKKWKMELKG